MFSLLPSQFHITLRFFFLSPSFAFRLRCLKSLVVDGWSNSVGQHACVELSTLHYREKSAMDKGMRCVLDYTFLFLLPLLFFFFFSSHLFHSISSSDDICSLALSPLNTSHTSPMMMTTSLTREAHQTPGTHSFTSSCFFLSFIFLQGRRGGGEEGRRGGGCEEDVRRRRGGEKMI